MDLVSVGMVTHHLFEIAESVYWERKVRLFGQWSSKRIYCFSDCVLDVGIPSHLRASEMEEATRSYAALVGREEELPTNAITETFSVPDLPWMLSLCDDDPLFYALRNNGDMWYPRGGNSEAASSRTSRRLLCPNEEPWIRNFCRSDPTVFALCDDCLSYEPYADNLKAIARHTKDTNDNTSDSNTDDESIDKTFTNWDERSEYLTYCIDWTTKEYSRRMLHWILASRARLLDSFPPNRRWILRNLKTHEFVRAEAIALDPNLIHGPVIEGIGFGHVIMSRICWASKDDDLPAEISRRGSWVGHKFDIVPMMDDLSEWTDVSDQANDDIDRIWSKKY